MKVCILTIIDNNNYGNRLQNYALQTYLKSISNAKVTTLKNFPYLNDKKNFIINIGKHIKFTIKTINKFENKERKLHFRRFNKKVKFSFKTVTAFSRLTEYDYSLCGSDQVWNNRFGRLRDVDLLCFVKPEKKIAYAASFGVNDIPEKAKTDVSVSLKEFKAISVREDSGKKIVEELTGRTDVEVLIDPTMLLTADEWDKVSKKPTMLKTDKYILNYFLGNLSDERKNEVNRVAKENNCEVINILDKESPFYECGPSEFLYLEKNAFLICTDSFHSSVFGILYNTPFLVFEREDNNASMNSRLDTLLSKFKLEDRRYKGKITKKDLKCDYTEAYNILDKERIKSMNFLKKALDIKGSDKND